ncbi:MAG: hypothetical protein M1837_003132 [Sclerophora amabilis]|nr:MAG: hypothetical protein M1837_003132 [Sclerophora amabilis]
MRSSPFSAALFVLLETANALPAYVPDHPHHFLEIPSLPGSEISLAVNTSNVEEGLHLAEPDDLAEQLWHIVQDDTSPDESRYLISSLYYGEDRTIQVLEEPLSRPGLGPVKDPSDPSYGAQVWNIREVEGTFDIYNVAFGHEQYLQVIEPGVDLVLTTKPTTGSARTKWTISESSNTPRSGRQRRPGNGRRPSIYDPPPTVPSPEPVASKPEPEVSEPEPEVSEPEPEVSGPEPEVSEPEPEVSGPEPEVSEPEPEVSEPEPEVSGPEPEASEPEPEASDPQPPVTNSESSVIPELDDQGQNEFGNHEGETVTQLQTTGVIRAMMVFVDFDSAPSDMSTEDAGNAATGNGGFQDLFSKQSKGALEFQVEYSQEWRRISDNFVNQEFPSDEYLEAIKTLYQDADFSNHDMVLIVPSGTSSIVGSVTHPAVGEYSGGDAFINSVMLGSGVVKDGSFLTTVHETGHVLGLPDLYPVGGQPSTTGCWDVMSDFSHASGFIGYHRHQLGWIAPEREKFITAGGSSTFTLESLDADAGTALVAFSLGPSAEAPSRILCFQSVSPVVRGGDPLEAAVAGEGVLVYLVDATLTSMNNPIQVQPKQSAADNNYGEMANAPYLSGDEGSFESGGYTVNWRVETSSEGTNTVSAEYSTA